MTRLLMLLTLLLALNLTGCVGAMPQTADEFRKALPGAFMGEHEVFEVNRNYKQVGKTFQKMAPKCLDIKIKTVSQTTTSYQVIVAKYTPTVVIGKKRAELHLQEKHEQGVMNIYDEPKAGHYLLVVDATPIGKNRTRIDFYRPSMGREALYKAIRGWATGKNVGCPDMAQ